MPIYYQTSTITPKSAEAWILRKKRAEQKVERIFFTFTEAQEFLGVSHQTVYKLMKEGLPSHKIGKKRVFLKDDLIKWIKDH